LYFQRRELIYKATVCSSSVGLALESNGLCHPYTGGTNNWRYKEFLSK